MQVSFGGLLFNWKNRKIPLVTKDIFGNKLTYNNVTATKVGNDCVVLVGDKKHGNLNDKEVIDYFMQFIHYPEYRKYIINTIRALDSKTEI